MGGELKRVGSAGRGKKKDHPADVARKCLDMEIRCAVCRVRIGHIFLQIAEPVAVGIRVRHRVRRAAEVEDFPIVRDPVVVDIRVTRVSDAIAVAVELLVGIVMSLTQLSQMLPTPSTSLSSCRSRPLASGSCRTCLPLHRRPNPIGSDCIVSRQLSHASPMPISIDIRLRDLCSSDNYRTRRPSRRHRCRVGMALNV